MFKKLIDKYFFNRILTENFTLTEHDLAYLKEVNNNKQLYKIFEKIKANIASTSLMATTVAGIQRRNNWIECLNHLQRISNIDNKKTDFRTMKKIKGAL